MSWSTTRTGGFRLWSSSLSGFSPLPARSSRFVGAPRYMLAARRKLVGLYIALYMVSLCPRSCCLTYATAEPLTTFTLDPHYPDMTLEDPDQSQTSVRTRSCVRVC